MVFHPSLSAPGEILQSSQPRTAGISIADILAGINAPLPHYRFAVLQQKATELAQEVRALGCPAPTNPKKTAKPVQEKAEKKVSETTQKVSTEGKGGTQHRYLQNLAKKIVQERGYKANIEESVLGGEGSIDVAINGYGEKIACEFTVTTGYAWEVQNMLKCLAAGYNKVFAISSDHKKLSGLKRFAQKEIKAELDEGKILFFKPPELIPYFDQKRAESASEEKTVRGYSVKIEYSPMSEKEEKAKMDAIARISHKSSKKLSPDSE